MRLGSTAIHDDHQYLSSGQRPPGKRLGPTPNISIPPTSTKPTSTSTSPAHHQQLHRASASRSSPPPLSTCRPSPAAHRASAKGEDTKSPGHHPNPAPTTRPANDGPVMVRFLLTSTIPSTDTFQTTELRGRTTWGCKLLDYTQRRKFRGTGSLERKNNGN